MIQSVIDLVRPLPQTGGERAESPASLPLRVHRPGHLSALPYELGVAGQGVYKPSVGCPEQTLAHRAEPWPTRRPRLFGAPVPRQQRLEVNALKLARRRRPPPPAAVG